MAKAPLSQTVVLTEDGTTVTLAIADAVTIPPLIVATVDNTLAGSDRLAGLVIGFVALFAALEARALAAAVRREALATNRLALAASRGALTTRIAELES